MPSRRGVLFWLGCGLLASFAAIALSAPWLAPYDPATLSDPPLATPSRAHLLGTNDIGQDVASQLLYGTQTTLLIAGSVTAASTLLSWLVGVTAGFVRRLEVPLMGVTDLLLALPGIPLAVLVLTLLGPGRSNVIGVLALLSWPSFARIVRSIVLQTRSSAYVEAARALGANAPHIALRHLLPATLVVLPTKLILTVRYAVFAESTLAFLGLASSDTVSWGQMLNRAFNDALLFSRPVWPWLVLPPIAALMTLLLATAWVSERFTGDG